MATHAIAIGVVIISYLIGAISFAVIVSRAMRLTDPRKFGSGNPGATNVLRTGNKLAASLTLLGDIVKGWLGVYLAQWASTAFALPKYAVAASAVTVFLGHLYPVFLRFKGGKGVATALGVLLAIHPALGLATAATWLIIAYAFRYSSLAAIISAFFAPLYFILGSGVAWRPDGGITFALVIISAFLLLRHQTNISRLMHGKEPRIGQQTKRPR